MLSEADPVAAAVGARWGAPELLAHDPVAGPLRRLGPTCAVVRRPGLHIHDDGLAVGPERAGDPPPTLVFASVHRSAESRPALTVHPLGNPGDATEVGGRPRTLVATDPRRMADALRRVRETGDELGWPVSFEATHHGPALRQPAFFVEIGAPELANPPELAVRRFAELLPRLVGDPGDRVAIGLGGGHYAPHFTELALERRWAFGHLLPRHALEGTAARGLVEQAMRLTDGAEGALYHRSRDADELGLDGLARRLRDKDAPRREGVRSAAAA